MSFVHEVVAHFSSDPPPSARTTSFCRIDHLHDRVTTSRQKPGHAGLLRPAAHNLIRYDRLIGFDTHMFERDLLLSAPSMLI